MLRQAFRRRGFVPIVLAISAIASAAGPTVIFSDLASSATSMVPGLSSLRFTSFDRPYVSPNGNYWIFSAITNSGSSTNDEVVVLGGGNTSLSSATVLREGPTFFDASINWVGIDQMLGINDNGHFAFSADTTAGLTVDETASRWNGSAFELMAREGSSAPGQAAGVGFGSAMDSVNLLNNGNLAFRNSGLTNATTQQAHFSLTAPGTGTVLNQTDSTAPSGQFVAPNQTLDGLGIDDLVLDGTGANHIYLADLNGPTTTDEVMVFNGQVVAQEGVVLPGSGFSSIVSDIVSDPQLEGSHYLFRGRNADAQDWVFRNGLVVAQTDAPIYSGATELFDDAVFAATFFLNTGNASGDYIIGGVTNNANVNTNAVIVLNGLSVVAREGDAVDLDGNGLFDDDAFISVFNNDDAFLTSDLRFFFTADLRNGAGTALGQAFLMKPVPEPGTLVALGLGLCALSRKRRR